jgi:hypothetical protein
MATRSFPVGAISELIADCAHALAGIEVTINRVTAGIIRLMAPSLKLNLPRAFCLMAYASPNHLIRPH